MNAGLAWSLGSTISTVPRSWAMTTMTTAPRFSLARVSKLLSRRGYDDTCERGRPDRQQSEGFFRRENQREIMKCGVDELYKPPLGAVQWSLAARAFRCPTGKPGLALRQCRFDRIPKQSKGFYLVG